MNIEDFTQNDAVKFTNLQDFQSNVMSIMNIHSNERFMFLNQEVGTGKTYICSVLCLYYNSLGFKCLYANKSLMSLKSFKKELKDKKENIKNVTITTYNSIKKYKNNKYGLIILDEIHNIKNPKSKRRNEVEELIKNNKDNVKIIILTGTPIINFESDYDNILKIISNNVDKNEKIITYKKKNELRNDIKIQYVGEKTKIGKYVLCKMKDKQLIKYEQENYERLSVINNKMLLKGLYTEEEEILTEHNAIKIEKFINIIDKGETHILFCFYVEKGINIIKKALEETGRYTDYENKDKDKIKYGIISGQLKEKDNTKTLNVFNSIGNYTGEKIRVLIASFVLSESISLYFCKNIHIIIPPWNEAKMEQMIGRLTRYTSTINDIKVYRYMAVGNNIENSYDYKMWSLIQKKKNLIKNYEYKNNNTEMMDNYNDIINIENSKNRIILKKDKITVDITDCLQNNPHSISWAKFDESKIIWTNNTKCIIDYYKPKREIDAWKSIIDKKIRLNRNYRGVILENVKNYQLVSLLKSFKIPEGRTKSQNIELLLNHLKSIGRYCENQVTIKSPSDSRKMN